MTSPAPLGKQRHSRRSWRGFTLIELMIVCAIVAILAAVAYPSYRDSVLKGKRAEGRTAVLDLLQQQERFFTQSNSYMSFAKGATGAVGTLADSTTTNPIPFKTFSGDNASNAAYRVGAQTCPNSSSNSSLRECVEVFANPVVDGSDPKVGRIWARSTGEKGCDGKPVPAPCWK